MRALQPQGRSLAAETSTTLESELGAIMTGDRYGPSVVPDCSGIHRTPSLLPCPEEHGAEHEQDDDDDDEYFAHDLRNRHPRFECLELDVCNGRAADGESPAVFDQCDAALSPRTARRSWARPRVVFLIITAGNRVQVVQILASAPVRGVAEQVLHSRRATVDSLAIVTAQQARSQHEVERPCQIAGKCSDRATMVRPSPGLPRSPAAMPNLPRRDRDRATVE